MDPICVPIALDAYCLTTACCDGKEPANPCRIGPITQPNYTGLRLNSQLIRHDVLDPVDIHRTRPAALNPRVADLGRPKPAIRENRIGIYLHWSLPRAYRGGSATAEGTTDSQGNNAKPPGQDPLKGGDGKVSDPDSTNPVFREVPNRWLVVRRLKPGSSTPANALPEFQGWVVESDRVWRIDNIDDRADLELDVSPFVESGNPNDDDAVQKQAEIFIGRKTDAIKWADERDSGKSLKLTIMSSSNPLFADYTPHNANVFSICDNLSFGNADNPSYLQKALASYCVIGWHSKSRSDPFNVPGRPLAKRIEDLKMQLSETDSAKPDFQLDKEHSTRLLCHGTMSGVSWNRSGRPGRTVADEVGQAFRQNIKMEPVSIGSSPLESLLTFINAHGKQMKDVAGQDLSKLAADVQDIATLLLAADDSYDSQIKAQDLLYSNNFANGNGGILWTFQGDRPLSSSAGPPAEPVYPVDHETIQKLNHLQTMYDVTARALSYARWLLWAEWWNLVSDRNNQDAAKESTIKARVGEKFKHVVALDNLQKSLEVEILNAAGRTTKYKQASKQPFFQRKDPTASIVGMPNPWDELEKQTSSRSPGDMKKFALIRFASTIPTAQVDPKSAAQAAGIPSELKNAALKLLGEFQEDTKDALADTPPAAAPAPTRAPGPAPGAPAPAPGGSGSKTEATAPSPRPTPWLRSFNDTQPFFPLFVEVEMIYYHIPKDKWQLDTVVMGRTPEYVVRYAIEENLDTGKFLGDVRTLSARVLILPQQALSLSSMISQLLEDNPKVATSVDIEELVDKTGKVNTENIERLKYLTLSLTGITNHLITRNAGSHVKPLARLPGRQVQSVNSAVFATKIDQRDPTKQPIFTTEQIRAIGVETGMTPYGNLLNFDPNKAPPFKAVTHGQAMITKLNIIDKFGQVLPALEPKPRKKDRAALPASLYPCISDTLLPNPTATGYPNVVYRDAAPPESTEPLNRFIQLTPAINQESRFNCDWVKPVYKLDSKGKDIPGTYQNYWRKTNDWEQPIWGWIVVNYANYGMQFFLPDGTFYTEVRIGGPLGSTQSQKWLPFGKPELPNDEKNRPNKQLTQLLERVTGDPDYLMSFFDMINGSIKAMPYPPREYADFASSIVGKPLALANIGYSLELASPPFEPQNTLPPGDNVQRINPDETLDKYKFELKIGDYSRPFDGLVAYFDMKEDPRPPSANPDIPLTKEELNPEIIHTYFLNKDASSASTTPDKRVPIGVATDGTKMDAPYPTVTPYWIDPLPNWRDSPSPQNPTAPYPDFSTEHHKRYHIKAVIIDPYTPLHLYSPILPITTLQLPAWTVQAAARKMTAFFHLGPMLITRDVAPYHQVQKATADISGGAAGEVPEDPAATVGVVVDPMAPLKPAKPSISVPMSAKEKWRWLQPYVQGVGEVGGAGGRVGTGTATVSGPGPGAGAGAGTRSVGAKHTVYGSLPLVEEDGRPKFPPGPYTAVEGYLQLLEGIVRPQVGGV